jgi:hypothetical protein
MGEHVVEEPGGERLLPAEGLVEPSSEERAQERREEQLRHRALVRVARVEGRDVVGLGLEDGRAEPGHPLGRGADRVRLDDEQGPDAEAAGDPERDAQRRAPAGHAVEGDGHPLGDRPAVTDEDEGQAARREFLPRGVRGLGVHADEGGGQVGEVPRESLAHGGGDRPHRLRVVVGEERHREVAGPQVLDRRLHVGSERVLRHLSGRDGSAARGRR